MTPAKAGRYREHPMVPPADTAAPSSSSGVSGDLRVGLWLWGIVAFAFGLRIYGLDFQSLWSDEIYSLAMSGTSLSESLDRVGRDVHPPLYFLALHLWVALFGSSEFAVRMLSALPSALAVVALFALGRRLLGARAGLAAAAICALSSFQIYYAQEARSYALMSLLAILSMDAFTRWNSRSLRGANRGASWLYYVVVSTALLYTHYFGVFVLAVQNLWLMGQVLVSWRRASPLAGTERAGRAMFVGASSWLTAQLAVAALFAVWLPVFLQQTDSVGGDFWIREPGSYMLFRSLLIGASLHRPPWGYPVLWLELLRNFLAFAVVFAGAAFFFSRARAEGRSHSERRSQSGQASLAPTQTWAWSLLGLWLLLPALAAFFLSTLSINVYTHRNLIVSSPALFLLVGGLFARLPGRLLPALLLAAALAPAVTLYPWYYGTVHKGQWREMTGWLSEQAKPTDGFVFDAPFIRRNFDFYRAGRNYHFIDVAAAVRQKQKPMRQRIWLVRAHQAEEERRIQQIVEAWGYVPRPAQRFRDIEVFLYERR